MKLHLLSILTAAVLLFPQLCWAQTSAPVDGNPKLTDRSGSDSKPESWRVVNHNGTWWYYHPSGSWSSWDGTRWNAYHAGANASATETTANAAARKSNSGDVEQSGAELGLGSGPNYASGLAPRGIGATVNGKGAPPK